MWSLRGRRLDHDILEGPELTAMRESSARGPGAHDHLDRLVEARLRLPRRNAEALELAVPVALADDEIEPAAGDQIESRRLLGQQDRIVPRQHHDCRAEPQRARPHRQSGEQRERGRYLVPTGEMVLDRK